ncbi:MAG: cupin domain-containing protein [Parvibaculaceae bacterium]
MAELFRARTVARKVEEEPGDDVGVRLAKLRKAYGLSQRELARRAGVTNGTISSIELNLTSPQVGSLRKILAVFPITMADFFSMDTEQSQQIFFSSKDLVELGAGGVSIKLAGAQNRQRKMQIYHEEYEIDGDTGEQMLVHEGEEAGIVIRGRLEVTVGNQKNVLRAGDAYHFDSSIPHRFRNVGDEKCEVVSAATPPSF